MALVAIHGVYKVIDDSSTELGTPNGSCCDPKSPWTCSNFDRVHHVEGLYRSCLLGNVYTFIRKAV